MNVFRVDDPRSEPRVLHELTLKKKMAEDAESDIAIGQLHDDVILLQLPESLSLLFACAN